MSSDIVLIGARGGSKRVPRKNLLLIGGIPLIVYPIKIGLNLGLPVYVSTEDVEIAKVSEDAGAIVIQRPKELSSDISTDYDWITHAVNVLAWQPDERIIFLRPTTPFRDMLVVKNAISSFRDEFTSLRSIEPLKENIQKAFNVERDFLVSAYPLYEGMKMIYKTKDLTNLPNQTFPTSYTGNGYVDILRRNEVQQGSVYGNKIQAFVTTRVVEIDTLEDAEFANWKVKKQNEILL